MSAHPRSPAHAPAPASWFTRLASWVSYNSGHSSASLFSLIVVLVWLIAGPWMRYSDTWQLIMNTCSSIVTFVMVFLIQNSQNRDSAAIQLKLNEIMKVLGARKDLLDVESLSQEELTNLKEKLTAARNDESIHLEGDRQ